MIGFLLITIFPGFVLVSMVFFYCTGFIVFIFF